MFAANPESFTFVWKAKLGVKGSEGEVCFKLDYAGYYSNGKTSCSYSDTIRKLYTSTG